MTTYNGIEITPTKATEAQAKALQQYVSTKEEIAKLYEKLESLLKTLPVGVPMVANILTTEGDTKTVESRTYMVGTPTGTFVSYKSLDFVKNEKTTKKDLKEITGE